MKYLSAFLWWTVGFASSITLAYKLFLGFPGNRWMEFTGAAISLVCVMAYTEIAVKLLSKQWSEE